MVEDTDAVLDSFVPKEVSVQSQGGAWYSMRIRPNRTVENVIESAVISCFDITRRKRAQDAAREGERLRRLAGFALDAHDAIVVFDLLEALIPLSLRQPEATRMARHDERVVDPHHAQRLGKELP